MLCCHVDIGHCHLSFRIYYYFQLLLGYSMLICPNLHLFSCFIIWCIINKYNMIITVLLLENRLHVVDVAIFLCIHVSGHHYTEWHFFIFLYFVFKLEVMSLCYGLFRIRRLIFQLHILLCFSHLLRWYSSLSIVFSL